jgi:hypothetical protein
MRPNNYWIEESDFREGAADAGSIKKVTSLRYAVASASQASDPPLPGFRRGRQVWDRLTVSELLDFRKGAALAALIQGFGGAEAVAFAAELAFRGRGAGALLAGTRLGLGQSLAAAGEAGFADGDASATGAFGTSLAAVSLALVGVAFARPLVLLHSATGTRRRRNRFPNTSALLFFRFHKGYRAG